MTFFSIAIAFTILQRLIELRIARRNTQALFLRGAIEVGGNHYWMLIVLHSSFFVSLVVEYLIRRPVMPASWSVFLILFAGAQAGRAWVMRAMKGRWTTRIIVLPGENLVASGPFKFVAHPNYLVVAVEILFLPLIFGLTFTAVIFTVLNAFVLLAVRIPQERVALRSVATPKFFRRSVLRGPERLL